MPTKSRCRLAWPPPLVVALWIVGILAPTCRAATSVSATRPTELLDWPTFGICVGCVAGVVWAWIIVVWAWVRLDDDVWELEAAEEDERRLQEAESARQLEQQQQQQQPLQESNSQDTRDPTATTLHEGQISDQGTATTTQPETTTRGVENEPFAPAQQTNADQQSSTAAQQQGSTSSSTAPPAAQDASPSSQPPLVARTPSSRPAGDTTVPARAASQNDVSATQAESAPPRDELRESTMTTTTGVSSLNASTTETRPRSESIRRRPLTRPRSRSEVTRDSLSRHDSQMTVNSDTTPQPQQEQPAQQQEKPAQQQEQPAPQRAPPQERDPRQDAAGRQTPNGQAEDGGEAPRSPAKPQRVVTIVTDTREIAVGTEDVFEGLAARGTNRDLIDAQQWIESKRRAVANVDPSPFVEDRPRPVPLLQSHPATGAAEATPRSSTARRDAAQPHTDRGTSRSISMPTPRMAAVADPVAPTRRQLPVERSIDAASNNGYQSDTPDAVAHRGVHTDTNAVAPSSRQRPLSAGNRSPSHQGGRRASLPLPITNSPDDGEALPPLFEAGDVLLRTYRFPLFEVDLGGSIGVIAPGEACVVDLVEVLYDHSGRYSFSYHFVGGDRAVEQRTVELHMTRVSRDGAKHFEFDDPGAAVRASAAQTPRY